MQDHAISRALTVAGILGVAGFAASPAASQSNLPLPSGEIRFSGTFEDYLVPNVRGTIIEFSVYGADGGDARNNNNPNSVCFESGGQGATARMDVLIDAEGTAFRPGGLLRFIAGEAGETSTSSVRISTTNAGGGGGSALLYTPSDPASLLPILVAGGGGGAVVERYLFGCRGLAGSAARVGTSGGDGAGTVGWSTLSRGGMDGLGGTGYHAVSDEDQMLEGGAGGGGWLSGGLNPDGDEVPEGGQAGGITGGAGGFLENGRSGGFGFGGGGAAIVGELTAGGGGGGGYSGGGGSSGRGTGGGSFADPVFSSAASNSSITEGAPNENGSIVYEVIGQAHDERANALPIDIDDEGAVTIVGLVTAASPSPVLGSPDVGPDVWYTYTNPSDTCSEVLRLVLPFGADVIVIGDDGVPVGPSGFIIEAAVKPSERVDIRVGNSSPFFVIPGTIRPLDADGDGVCEDLDICPGVDDATLDPADDVDADGIHDVCDKACPEDVWPDGEFTDFDLLIYSFFVANAGPDSLPRLDFDASGEIDYFDWVEVFDWCD
ncbi:MAG: hypothetical protein AAFR76_10130 [Planctomycetota bacterium]